MHALHGAGKPCSLNPLSLIQLLSTHGYKATPDLRVEPLHVSEPAALRPGLGSTAGVGHLSCSPALSPGWVLAQAQVLCMPFAKCKGHAEQIRHVQLSDLHSRGAKCSNVRPRTLLASLQAGCVPAEPGPSLQHAESCRALHDLQAARAVWAEAVAWLSPSGQSTVDNGQCQHKCERV